MTTTLPRCRADHALPYGKTRCDALPTSFVWDGILQADVPVCQEWADVYGAQGARIRPFSDEAKAANMAALGDLIGSVMPDEDEDDECARGLLR